MLANNAISFFLFNLAPLYNILVTLDINSTMSRHISPPLLASGCPNKAKGLKHTCARVPEPLFTDLAYLTTILEYKHTVHAVTPLKPYTL